MFPENTVRFRGSAPPDKKSSLFKTEMCRNWAEMGYCRYGQKCRFAHGDREIRIVQRHVRYKTEICRAYHKTGTCLYGVRCTFIHDNDDDTTSTSSRASVDDLPSDLLLDEVVIVTAAYDSISASIGLSKRRLGAFSSICDQPNPWQSSSASYDQTHLSSW